MAKGGVTYRDEPWHKECFVCTGCKMQLAGQQFTSREDSPYCLKCFGNLYAKKCESCSKPITGTAPPLATPQTNHRYGPAPGHIPNQSQVWPHP